MGPMFDVEPILFGVPARVLAFGIGAVGAAFGFSLVRRAVRGEPEARAFRATAEQPVDRLAIAGLAMTGLLIAVVAYLALWR